MRSRFLWRAFKARYRDEAVELRAIRDHVRPGDTVCDIGANKGSYLWWLSRWVGPGGRVVAFEPQAELADYLHQVCRNLALANVAVEAKAVDAETGRQTFYVPGESGSSPGASLGTRLSEREVCRSLSVAVVALDDYFDAHCRIGALKVDVEGAEKGVFQGARRVLSEQSPLLVFECEQRHLESGDMYDVFRMLHDLAYEGHFVCGKKVQPLSEFDPAIHQKQDGPRFWDRKDYCNNFIFRKRA